MLYRLEQHFFVNGRGKRGRREVWRRESISMWLNGLVLLEGKGECVLEEGS